MHDDERESPAGEVVRAFDRWLTHAFDHPEGDRDWWVLDDADPVPPVTLAGFLARLFEHPAVLMERFTPQQVDDGLWYVGGVGSGYFQAARGPEVPIPLQQRWVRAMQVVYRDLFAPHCTVWYGHLDRGPEPPHPLNSSCYMWWDRDCIEGAAMAFGGRGPQQPHLVDPIFEVLEGALALRSIACQESALHGLGHLQPYHPARVAAIIDRWLAAGPHPAELVTYARAAHAGCVQ